MSAYNLNIEALTPVHIGDGVFLQKGSDFITIKRTDESGAVYLVNFIIDPQKVLACIGEEHLADWMASIERHSESVWAFAKRYKKDIRPEDLSKRAVYSYASESRPTDTLKTCMHNGMGFPYIPGSSIKGAIRTAVFASMVSEVNNLSGKVAQRFSSKPVEDELFGRINEDVFRFLQVGDAYFPKDCEISTRMVSLNITKDSHLYDASMPQLVEAIGTDSQTTFQLTLASDTYQWVKGHYDSKKQVFPEFPTCMTSLPALFKAVNAQTQKLLEEEIRIWTDLSEQYTGAEVYVENLKGILASTEACQAGKECVLRIGYGSGWRFITGAWCEQLNIFDRVIDRSRPRNHNYIQYRFPKTRRIDTDSDILGFVKLSFHS